MAEGKEGVYASRLRVGVRCRCDPGCRAGEERREEVSVVDSLLFRTPEEEEAELLVYQLEVPDSDNLEHRLEKDVGVGAVGLVDSVGLDCFDVIEAQQNA